VTLKLPIYLDNHATTLVDPRVFEAMKPYFSEIFGNPASATHSFGWMAEEAVKQAREQVAKLIHADPKKEIIWTSGTTESINMALLGISKNAGDHIISVVTEHRAALETLKFLEGNGIQVTYLPVDSHGLVDPENIRKAITPKTVLISVMAANNEIGTIHPIAEIGKIAKEMEILFHVDAAQACGKIPVDVQLMGIDLLSMSAHKVYGPKGVGALYIRRRNPHVKIEPLIYGGSHEGGLRGGTLNVPGIVGMGKAFEIAGQEMETESLRLVSLRDRLYQKLSDKLPQVMLNGHPTQRLAGNLNVSFLGVRSSDLISQLKDIAISSGSACTSGSLEPSYVIRALGVGEERARSSIRIGLGRFNTEEEIYFAVDKISHAVSELSLRT